MGLFQGGEFELRKTINDGLHSHTTANTTGLVLTKTKVEGEKISEYGKTVVSGICHLLRMLRFSEEVEMIEMVITVISVSIARITASF